MRLIRRIVVRRHRVVLIAGRGEPARAAQKYLASRDRRSCSWPEPCLSGTAAIARVTRDQNATLSRDPLRHRVIRNEREWGTSFRSALRRGGGREPESCLFSKKTEIDLPTTW